MNQLWNCALGYNLAHPAKDSEHSFYQMQKNTAKFFKWEREEKEQIALKCFLAQL